MLTAVGTLEVLKRLVRNIRSPGVPTLNEIEGGIAADWVALLPEMDDDELAECAVALLRSPNPFWPTPGQLLALSPRTKRAEAAELGAKSAAQRCFYEVLQARSSYGEGYYGPIVNLLGHEGNTALEVQIQAGVKAIGGWRAMGRIEESEHQWREKDFTAAFLAARAIAKADKALTTTPLRAITGGK